MTKQVFIINGSGGVGKDTVCSAAAQSWKVQNISSITPILQVAKAAGWDGTKTPAARRFLSQLKADCTEFNDLPFRYCTEQLQIFAENDATVAGLAESRFGSTKEHDTSVMITLGTGVGGAIIINGKPFSGAHGVGSEIGHMMIGDGWYKCNCGNTGCFETYCSATAIIKYAQKLLSEGEESIILDICKQNISDINAKMIFDAYNQDDEVAKKVIARFKDYLAKGIANIVNTIDPGIIAIGGGVSKSEDIILDGLKEMVRGHLVYKEEEFADIVIATLGNDAGIIGAAILG